MLFIANTLACFLCVYYYPFNEKTQAGQFIVILQENDMFELRHSMCSVLQVIITVEITLDVVQ